MDEGVWFCVSNGPEVTFVQVWQPVHIKHVIVV